MNHESDLMNHGFSEEDIVRLRASSAKTGTEMDHVTDSCGHTFGWLEGACNFLWRGYSCSWHSVYDYHAFEAGL